MKCGCVLNSVVVYVRTKCRALPRMQVQLRRGMSRSDSRRLHSVGYNSALASERSVTRTVQRTGGDNGYTRFPRRPNQSGIGVRILVGAAGAGVIYAVYHLERAPFTKRWRVISMSTQREMELGRRAYDELIHSVQRAVLEPNDAHSLRARRVVTRLARACKGLDAELSKGFKWSVAVCEDDMPNAVCVPGGRMLVTTGLLRLCSCDEEVAMVLSHEIAHAINRHSAEKMQVQMLMLPLVVVLSAVLSSHMMSASVSKLLLELPYGRKLEREADAVGLIVMTEACYDPRKGPVVFDKLAAVTREEEGGWISKRVKSMVSTHPMSKERAWQLRQQAAALALRFDERCVGAQTKALSIHDAGARCASPRGGTA